MSCKKDEKEIIIWAIVYYPSPTELLCPFDGSACVCCVALRQIHHLRADLPTHQRIQTYREQTCNVPVWKNLWIESSECVCVYFAVPAMEVWGLLPVLMSMKVPVPMVILTSPTSKQHSPNMAACWSAIYSGGTEEVCCENHKPVLVNTGNIENSYGVSYGTIQRGSCKTSLF